MKRNILLTAALASVVSLFALGAQAQDEGKQSRPPAQVSERMSISQIAAMLEERGYTVLEIELEHGRYDVEMRDANGRRVEAHLNPVTGEMLSSRNDDDYRDDDRRKRSDDKRRDRDDR